jgi:hypothetical protein
LAAVVVEAGVLLGQPPGQAVEVAEVLELRLA